MFLLLEAEHVASLFLANHTEDFRNRLIEHHGLVVLVSVLIVLHVLTSEPFTVNKEARATPKCETSHSNIAVPTTGHQDVLLL